MRHSIWLGCALLLAASASWAGDDTVRAAVGGGVGGAVGAAVGEELGDRNGAIVGGALGGAIGAAIATDDDGDRHRHVDGHTRVHVDAGGHPGRFCPPGQAKKGRC